MNSAISSQVDLRLRQLSTMLTDYGKEDHMLLVALGPFRTARSYS